MLYFRIEPGIHALYGIAADPQFPDGVNFKAGRAISETLPDPLVFEVDYPQGESPAHFMAMTIPVVSGQFLSVLRGAGVDNYQTFPALLRNPETGGQWLGFSALNVIGVVDAADLDSCTYDVVMPGGEGLPPLLDFKNIVFAGSKTSGLLMFRLPQNRRMLFVHERVREHLRGTRPPEGWGITTFEVPVR